MMNMYVKAMMFKERVVEALTDEQGLGTIEIAVIIIVLIGLALLFQTQIKLTLGSIFTNINKGIPEVK